MPLQEIADGCLSGVLSQGEKMLNNNFRARPSACKNQRRRDPSAEKRNSICNRFEKRRHGLTIVRHSTSIRVQIRHKFMPNLFFDGKS